MAEINGEEKRITVSGEQIEEVVEKVPTIEADVKSNKQSISALQTTSAQHTADIAKNTADIEKKANADEVYSRDETDNAITAKVAEIVAGAPEEFDTLKEMSDWLTEHSDSAATMNTAIQANTKAIADNVTAIEANTAEIANNKSDILSAKNDIAINQNTLGVQCKNLIPQEVEMGFYDDVTGAPMSGGTLIRVIGYAKVKPNTKYTISSNLNLFTIWKFNGNVAINRTEAIQKNSYTMTTPNNCNSLRICLTSPNKNVSDFEWIQVEEGTVATAYEPYKPSVNERLMDVEKSVIPYSEIPSTSTDEQLSALRSPAIIHTYFNANVFPDKLEGWGTLMVTSRGGSCTQTVFRNDGCILVRGCNSDGVFSSWHKFTGTALSQTQ
jgi:hypothetical protein